MENPRWALERAVLASGLPAQARHVLLTLVVIADWPEGTTPAQHTLSLTGLARATGLGRSTVARALTAAEEAGWVDRLRPDVAKARADKDRTRYRLKAPPTSPTAGLVPEQDQSQSGTSPGAGPDLVPERDGASPRAGHRPDPSQTSQTEEPHKAPKTTRGTHVPDDFTITPAMRTWYHEHAPDVDIAIETALFLDHWRAESGAKAIKRDWVAAWRKWLGNQQKWKTERTGNSRSNGHQPYRDPEDASVYHQGSL